MPKPHKEWLYYADQDLLVARNLFDDGFFAHVCFHAKQAIEKMMKAILIAQKQPYPKTHDLIRLYNLLGMPEWLEEHAPHLLILSQIYIPIRYPEAVAGTLPDRMPGKEDAQQALQWAEEICQLIRKKI